MSRTQRMIAFLVATAGLVAPAQAQTAFTYQGQLRNAGVEVTTPVDVQYRLFNSAASGSQIGGTLQSLNLTPTDGLFQMDLDFGADAFDGSDRWLEIAVRNPAGSGSFVTLFPRQKVTAAPYAHTTRGMTVSANDDVDLVDSLFINGAQNFVGVGRDNRVSSQEAFGVQSPAVSGYGGMYVQTAGENAWPFYGYSADGTLAWTYFDGASGKWHVNNGGEHLTVRNSGNVGINETNPLYPLHIDSNEQRSAYARTTFAGGSAFYGEADGTGAFGIRGDADGTDGVGVRGTAQQGYGVIGKHEGTGSSAGVYGESSSWGFGATGVLGEVKAPNAGQISAGVRGINEGTNGEGFGVRGQHLGSGIGVEGTSLAGVGVNGYSVVGAGVKATSVNANIIEGFNGSGEVFRVENDGTTVVPVLQITGGSDLCEKFEVHGDVRAGMVVSIDAENIGHLRVSSSAVDRSVAGIVSGANGINPGMLMGQTGTVADGRYPIALTGRVWTWCDATDQAIEPGDLLTTSDTPGHAMKVADPDQAQGAVIGKAMTKLAAGERGMVLVLVNLQ